MKSSEIKFWVKKAQRHDKDAFTELMQLYMKDMYRTAIAILMKVDCNPRFPFCNRLSHFVSGLQNLYPKFHFCNTIPVPRDDFVL